MASPPNLPVQKVGEYDVVGHIGTGGMGVVYEGKHPVIGKRVAIKVLLPHFSADAGALKRFFDEARAVNAIGHRGIVDIFGMGQLPDGSHYLVMEHLEGQSFDQLLKSRKTLPQVEALGLLEEVLEAVGAAHEKKIIHRDLKPSNLFLVESGKGRPYVKLLDFGVAKLSSDADGVSKVEASAIVGTPIYMAPEQISGKRAGPPADIYALGVMLFELISGRPPFNAKSLVLMMSQHMEAKPPRLTELKPGTAPEVERLVDRMLAKQPQDRPQSAEELRAEVATLRARLEGANRPAATLPPLDDDVGPTVQRPAQNDSLRPIDNGPTTVDQAPPTIEPPVHHPRFLNTELPTEPVVKPPAMTFANASSAAMSAHSAPTLTSEDAQTDPLPPRVLRSNPGTDPTVALRAPNPSAPRRDHSGLFYLMAGGITFLLGLLLMKLLG